MGEDAVILTRQFGFPSSATNKSPLLCVRSADRAWERGASTNRRTPGAFHRRHTTFRLTARRLCGTIAKIDAGQIDTARVARIASASRCPLRAEFAAIYRMPDMRVSTIDSSTALRLLPSRRHNRHNDREIHMAFDRGSMTIDRGFPMFSCHHLTTASHPHDHLPEGRALRPEQCRLILGHHAMT